MPQYTVRNKATGETLVLRGERPPTEQELERIFAAKPDGAPASAPATAPTPAPEAPTPEPAAEAKPERGLGTTLQEAGIEGGLGMAGQAAGTLLGPVGTVAGGAVGSGTGNLINQFRRMHADPNETFKWGEFLASVGTGAIPGGGLAKTGAKAVAKEALKQGAAGLAGTTVRKVVDEGELPTAKEAILATALPAAGGAVAQKVLSSAPSAVAAVNAVKTPKNIRTLEAGAAEGLKFVPSSVDKSFITAQLESVGGKAAVNQRVQLANQEAVQNITKKALGVAQDVELSPQVTKQIRAHEGKVYDAIEKAADKAKADLEKLEQLRQQVTNVSNPAQRAIEEAKFQAKYGTKITQLTEQAAASVLDLRKLRGESQGMWDAYFNSAGKNVEAQQKAIALGQQAEALETAMEQTLRKYGKGNLADRLGTARQRIAMTYNVDEAMNPGNWNIDPDVLARQLTRKVPLSGGLRLIAEYKKAAPQALREASKVTSPDVSLLGTTLQGLVGAGVGASTGNLPGAIAAATAVPLARKGAREYLLSSGMQQRAIQAGKPQAVTPLPLAFGTSAIRQTGREAGKAASDDQETPPDEAIKMLRENPSLAPQFNLKYGRNSADKYLKTR